MKAYLLGTILKLQTLLVFSNDGMQLGDNRIFHCIFWVFQPCINNFAYRKPIVQVDETWFYGKYIRTLLMVAAWDGNTNTFLIAFTLVEEETKVTCSFFLKTLCTKFIREIKDKELRKKVVNMCNNIYLPLL